MAKQKKRIIEYRNYDLPIDFPILLLKGNRWHISDIPAETLHIHNCLEIGICHTQSGTIEYGDSSSGFQAGDITCISRNIPHTTYSSPGESSLWSYLFLQPEDLVKNYIKDYPLIADKVVDLDQKYFTILSKEQYPQIHLLITAIIDELSKKEEHYQLSVTGLCVSLFIQLARIQSSEVNDENRDYSQKAIVLSPALNFIQTHYMNQLSLDDLAQLCHLSPTHFRRMFHSILHTTPLDFINTYRVLKSCTLLRSTEDSILSISEQVGFCSISSYNRHFSLILGTTPNKWRKSNGLNEKVSILEYRGWLDET